MNEDQRGAVGEQRIAEYLHPEMLIVLESTTYPGTTTEVILPHLQQNKDDLTVGEDFFLCFSPERVDPGREDWTTLNTPNDPSLVGFVGPETANGDRDVIMVLTPPPVPSVVLLLIVLFEIVVMAELFV